MTAKAPLNNANGDRRLKSGEAHLQRYVLRSEQSWI